jgi:hypothetical protein
VSAYLNNDAERFHVCVVNRVQFARDHTKLCQWQYIASEENPADHASRGRTVTESLTSNRFTGPAFLHNTDVKVKCTTDTNLMLGDPEIKLQVFSVQMQGSNDLLEVLTRYSDWNLVIRVIARVLRLTHSKAGGPVLTIKEISSTS